MEEAIKYFAVFGGLDIKIDTSKPLIELIEKHILKDYQFLRNEISSITGGYSVDQAVLSGIAQGDRRTHSTFKRAHVSNEEGMKCVEKLIEREVIEIESSLHFLINKRGDSKISKKLLFTTPYLRFWFAFISPIYKGIKEGKFEEFRTLYQNKEAEFVNFIFEELSMDLLRASFKDDPIIKLGKYWDENIEIDLLGKTKSGKIVVGNCKYTNSKIKKTELTKLKEDCKSIELDADIFVLFTRKGFTTELKGLKGENLKLFTAKSLKSLIIK